MATQDRAPATKAESQRPEDRSTKPEKPDEDKFKAEVAKVEEEHATLMEKLNAVKAKLDMTRPSAKGSPAQQRQQDLRAELSSIRQQQQQLKSSKGNLHEKIKQLDISVKSRMNEQKNARSRMPFKTVDEIDQRIQQLDKQVDTGTMKLVDEKKALGEISSLRKQRKGFAQFDEAQRGIDDEKAQLNELRKGLDDPEAKALSERYTAVAKELDDLRAEQDEAFKGINTLRDEKSKLHSEQQERYMAIRAIKDAYYSQKKAYTEYEHEAYKARKERQKAQRDAHEKERRKKIADQRLEEASQPAFLDEILTAEGLVRYFDPSAAAAAAATATGSSSSMSASGGSSKLAAQPSRTVDGPDFKGVKVIKKDDREENYFVGGGGKKGKKGRRNQQGGGTASPGGTSSPPDAGTATPTTTTTGTESTGGKFHLTIGIIEELSRIDLEPPMGPADVPAVVEKLKQKLEKWKKEQDAQTKANIEKAQKEIDRLETESSFDIGRNHSSNVNGSAPSSTATASNNNNDNNHNRQPKKKATTSIIQGDPSSNADTAALAAEKEQSQEKDAAEDVAEELKAATLEDQQQQQQQQEQEQEEQDEEE